MGSASKFPSGLNNWALSDKPEMDDFVNDNRLLDDNAMWKTVYDADGSVASAGGIIVAVEAAVNAKVESILEQLLAQVYPVGSYYISTSGANPAELLGVGTWSRVKGRVVLGVDEDDADFSVAGNIGGEKAHTLTEDEMPSHAHEGLRWNTPEGWHVGLNSGGSGRYRLSYTTDGNGLYDFCTVKTGGGQPHGNLPPYETAYIWKRTE